MSLTNAPEAAPSSRPRVHPVDEVLPAPRLFNHWSWRRQGTESAVEVAVREGAVAVNVPDDGVEDGDKQY